MSLFDKTHEDVAERFGQNLSEIDMDIDSIFNEDDIDKQSVKEAFVAACMSGHISLDTHAQAQRVLKDWSDPSVSDGEQITLVLIFNGLNEMAENADNLDTEFVRSEEEVISHYKNYLRRL